MPKPYVEFNPEVHGELFRISRYRGICRWCEQAYYPGTKVNWNPRVKNTCCHAGCYKAYGSPAGREEDQQDITPTNPPKFVPNPNPEPPKPPSGLPQAILDAIEPYLKDKLHGLVSAEQVEKILDKILEGRIFKTVTTITIERETEFGLEIEDLGFQHKLFEDLLKAVKAGVNVWLTGPAGTGKTTAAENVAKALGKRFFFTGSIDTEYKLLGFVDAQGRIVNTAFREAFINGGVFLFDEVDSSLPAALLAFNAALANPYCAFPDGVFPRHKDFVAIAAANTWGLGGTNEFVGRVKLDQAFLDRFQAKIHWVIDEALELAIGGNEEWTRRVQRFRAVLTANPIKGVAITPRASIGGAKLLAVGFTQARVEELTMRSGMTDAQWTEMLSRVGGN